jgi:hypothetical protein
MRASRFLPIDDEVIEAIVDGRPVDVLVAAHPALVAFARGVRAEGDGPVPRPSPELAALLEGRAKPDLGTDDAAGVMSRVRQFARVTGKVAGLGLVAKIGLGASVAAACVTGAGATGILPAPADHAVRHAIEAVTPVRFSDHADHADQAGHTDDAGQDDRHEGSADPGPGKGADRTEAPGDAQDQGKGKPEANGQGQDQGGNEDGNHGPQIADDAPGSVPRPGPAVTDEPPGQSGDTGLTRADQTPAAPATPGVPEADDQGGGNSDQDRP